MTQARWGIVWVFVILIVVIGIVRFVLAIPVVYFLEKDRSPFRTLFYLGFLQWTCFRLADDFPNTRILRTARLHDHLLRVQLLAMLAFAATVTAVALFTPAAEEAS